MGKQFSGKRGLKRHKTPDKFEPRAPARNRSRVEDEVRLRFSPTLSGELSGEESSGGASDEMNYKDLTVYEKLSKLSSSNQSTADAYQKRQVAEDDVTDGSESLSASEEENGFEETDSVSLGLQEPDMVGTKTQTEDDLETSDTDEDDDLTPRNPTVASSSFAKHVEYKLSEEETDDLSKKKWKYTWEVPAADISNCKWVGSGECFLKDGDLNSNYDLKQKLYKHWLDVYKTSGGNDFHSSKQRWFFSLCNSYRDILHCEKKPFYCKGQEEDSNIMDAYLMHSLNHIFRTRDLVKKNDAKISKHQMRGDVMLAGDDFLDQGFTRPKVLILLPLRSIALRVIERLIQLTPTTSKVNVEHIDRFYQDFGSEEVEDDEEKEEQSKNANPKKPSKPSDHQSLFKGDTRDDFMIGIKFTRKTIKLYGDFYTSDIIFASPLELMTKFAKAEKNKELDTDYLSSIEVVIIDHADVISLQNWSFLTSVVERLNHIPLHQHGTNVMRIRQWYLDGFARFYRQTIILGYYLNPDMNALFNHHCVNYQGKVKSVREHRGVLPKVLSQVRQIYERFDAKTIADVDDARLEYFAKKVFPKIKDCEQGGIMLFASSYFEFVRLRNFLKSQNASFCLLGDYTDQKDISRARVWFFEGKRKIMLYTERIHFYRRYKIRGTRNLIIYSLPERKEFYYEIVNMLEGSDDLACTVLFSQFDKLKLERIVGSAPAKRMIKSEKGVFVFC
ncbi:nucleolar factor 1 [Hibiscus trionum]|uniref:Nucleolar factor 1 n=1 Tax=Hibiscus trionum TaxID=183268 RepID=A0A9W7MC39_HIBTR|nr:nucleolar factor 1 [Hibiscus trionum]